MFRAIFFLLLVSSLIFLAYKFASLKNKKPPQSGETKANRKISLLPNFVRQMHNDLCYENRETELKKNLKFMESYEEVWLYGKHTQRNGDATFWMIKEVKVL